jgi:hypothetical protein
VEEPNSTPVPALLVRMLQRSLREFFLCIPNFSRLRFERSYGGFPQNRREKRTTYSVVHHKSKLEHFGFSLGHSHLLQRSLHILDLRTIREYFQRFDEPLSYNSQPGTGERQPAEGRLQASQGPDQGAGALRDRPFKLQRLSTLGTPHFKRSCDERKKFDMRFAHLKTHH